MLDTDHIVDTRILGYKHLPTLKELQKEIPRSPEAKQAVLSSRRTIEAILDGTDPRILLVHGPCSVSEEASALEYAARSRDFAPRVSDKIFPVMRVYVEKPRTGIGWPGLIVDPNMNGEEDYNAGYRLGRRILSKISDMGVACATEYVNNTYTPQLIGEFVSWACIGARTSYSQDHRRMTSGLSSPVGFKNDDKGDISVAVNGVDVARQKGLKFLGPHFEDGVLSEITGAGNPYAHVVLRGGSIEDKEGRRQSVPNYDAASVRKAREMLQAFGLPDVVMIDCSHDNSSKDYRNQPIAFQNVLQQIRDCASKIVGIMIESHLMAGNYKLPPNLKGFDRSVIPYGTSSTDSCMPIDMAEGLMLDLHKSLNRNIVYFT